jgi:hypothetical protein
MRQTYNGKNLKPAVKPQKGVFRQIDVLRLCEVADFQHKCSFEKLNLNLALNCHRSTEPAILQNRC